MAHRDPSRQRAPFRAAAPSGDVEVAEAGGVTVVRVAGSLDVALAPRLERIVERTARDGSSRIVIDLSGCDFLASAGLSALARAGRLRADGVDLRLVADSRPVLLPLRITNLDGDFDIRPTLVEALADP
jgi:anti-anti-sigma factor